MDLKKFHTHFFYVTVENNEKKWEIIDFAFSLKIHTTRGRFADLYSISIFLILEFELPTPNFIYVYYST